MTTAAPLLSTSQVLSEVGLLLARLDPDRSALADRDRLHVLREARILADRFTALAAVLLAEVDTSQSSMRAAGTPLSSRLSSDGRLSKKEAAAALHRANDLAERPQLSRAATSGVVTGGQVRAITRVLGELTPQLSAPQQRAAEGILLNLAETRDGDQLAKAGPEVLRAVAPTDADELVETKLQREAEAARRERSLRWWRHGGSVRFEGSLPRVDGEAWLALLDAHAESNRRTLLEARDPRLAAPTPEQRQADALVAMINTHQVARQAPSSGGDRPRVVVTLSYQSLLADAAGAGLIRDDEPISAGELRQLCCDAELLPAMFGGPSEVLDIGRQARTIPRAIRAALHLRDGGCAFPGCATRPGVCEAHHIQPWWQGGPTALDNLVLLCHHHHALVEPARSAIRDQWQVRIAADQLPEFIPPKRADGDRKPVRQLRSDHRAPPVHHGGSGHPAASRRQPDLASGEPPG